ncbi:MAG TPA: hypothetical protein ENJ08_09530 [Gammaproteobacteria bacterium]|nr:hypothetical protein [Gammaproteobacteria bacterium]
MADSASIFKPIEITLKSGESYKISDTTVTLLTAGTKRSISGESALSVSLQVKDKNRKEILYFTRTDNTPLENWDTISISLLNGDNGIVLLKISPRQIRPDL